MTAQNIMAIDQTVVVIWRFFRFSRWRRATILRFKSSNFNDRWKGSDGVTMATLPVAKFTLRPSLAFSYIGTVTAWHSSSGRQPHFAALNRGRHLYSAGRPSRWALAHILVVVSFVPDNDILVYVFCALVRPKACIKQQS